MIKRLKQIEEIMEGLSLLQYYVKFSSNKLGLHDINKVCEPFFCELFNLMWDLKFKRLEYEEGKNFPGIDLGDKKNKKSMQITSDGSNKKLWDTIEQFEKHNQYVKYDDLYHFVIGEKHFKPKSKHEIEFEKKIHNIYLATRNIDGFEYQIHIIDLLDLILIIDSQETSTVISEIHEYITNNIIKPIGVFKGELYKLEPDELIQFTATSFIEYCSVEEDYQEQFLEDLTEMAKRINTLDRNTTRTFLYTALEKYKNKKKSYYPTDIEVDHMLVSGHLGIGDETTYRSMRILFGEELADLDSFEYDGVLKLKYSDSEGEDLLRRVFEFCLETERSLKELILEVDFSVLD
ncbi:MULTISPECIES: SMEK domain-containing protein [Metabacillus]|uniref:SMEK domain-containing protein n=1 Tax=Metabacillus TaxID=2675233 RepID=UPI000C8094AB|nr:MULTISPECIES: SMEK domain-containing protein [Metabacillus]MCM3443996.1 SMEK domain-containing protein [Metabacillus halosaccharovorans]PMC34953.1 hypothetical protein CJ195_20815 [Bacillus sp. UMB0899]